MNLPPALPEPWHWDLTDYVEELEKELSEKHILFGKKVKSIACRQDCDDVLFEIEGGDHQYAVVHLTWSQKQERDGRWPRAELYKDWDDVLTNRIVADSKDWA